MKLFAQGLRASELQSWDLNFDSLNITSMTKGMRETKVAKAEGIVL